MSNDSATEQAALKANPQAAFNERLADLIASLKVLAIKNNASGRNKFREKWPEIAAHLYGPKLIQMDTEGTNDLDARGEQEEEAELRYIALKNILKTVQENSVDSGFLKLDFIGQTIDKIGPAISLYIYSERIIERARPGVLANLPRPPQVPQQQNKTDAKLTTAEKQILSNQPSDQKPTQTNPSRTKKPLVPKGTLVILFNWLAAQKS